MIVVSDDFKESIRARNRQIKGYVEIIYNCENINGQLGGSGIQLDPAPIVDEENVLTGNRAVNNYASLEQDYFLLDGSFILPNDPDEYKNENTGYISQNIANYYLNDVGINYLRISNINNTNVKNMTIYYKDNIPKYVKLKIVTMNNDIYEQEINNNYSENVSFEFPVVSNISYINVYQDIFQYENRRIRIPKIEFGLTSIYKDNDLISFTTNEEIRLFVEETPINDCSVIINDKDYKFDLINPDGIVGKLNSNVKIVPNIGVVTNENGIEYVKMGDYYFDSYKREQNNQITIEGKNIMNKLVSESLIIKQSGFFTAALNKDKFINFLSINYPDYNFKIQIDNWSNIHSFAFYTDKLIEVLIPSALRQNAILYADRSSNIIMKRFDSTCKSSLTYNEMKSKPVFEQVDKINTVEFKKKIRNTRSASTTISVSHVLQNSIDYVVVLSENINTLGVNISQSGASSVSIVDTGYYILMLKIVGTVGNTVSITITSNQDATFADQYITYTNAKNGETKKVFSISERTLISFTPTNLVNHILNNAYQYKSNISFIGDPSIEAGDVISVETDYGNKNVFIQKISLTFNGSLSGSIEGVGD